MGAKKEYERGHIFEKGYCVFNREMEPAVTKHGTIRFFEVLCTYNNCETIFTTQMTSLNMGVTKSCGCFRKEKISKIWRKDVSGQRFGKIVLIKIVGHDKNNKIEYLYVCDCGHEDVILGESVVSGNTTSCGCARNVAQMFIFDNIVKPLCPDALSEYRLPNNQLADIAVPSLGTVIEFDGYQHNEMWYFDKGDPSKLEDRKRLDIKKEQCIKEIGWRLLRVPERSYKKNKKRWKETIEHFIKEAQNG